MSPTTRTYVCGHSDREHERLDLQSQLYGDITRRALLDAGLGPGMRIVDLGCGSGGVALLAAEIVGANGTVLGIDRDPGTVDAARRRAAARGARNATFESMDAGDGPADSSFDALVSRFFFMHQPDASATLRRAIQAIRPGGCVLAIESYMAGLLDAQHSRPYSPLLDRIVRWKCAVVAAAGANLHAGLELPAIFRGADLPAPATRMETRLDGGADTIAYRYLAESMKSMLPLAVERGIEGFDAPELDRLEAVLRDEVTSRDGTIMAWPVVTAWARVPPR